MKFKALRCLMLVLVLLLSGYPREARGCPACKDQVPTQKTADGRKLVDPYETQKGFALSIYVLLSAVYGLPALLGFVLWRSVKGAQARNRALRALTARPAVPATSPSEAGVPAIHWAPAREEAGS